MIIYFCDRELNILAHATTVLPAGNRISGDKLVEDVETGVNSFEGFVTWDDNTRQELESAVVAGNYILKKSDTEYDSLFQIIETESDTKAQEISFYSEDAGLDLLNTLCPAVTLTNRTLKQMLTYFMPAGWTINVTDAPTTTKTYKWDGESTCTERIRSVVSLWDCELYYSFRVEELQVKERIVNVTRKRGLQEAIPQLGLNYDIDRIVTKTSIADLVTALNVTGGTPDGSQTPINLKNYTYNYTDPVTGDRYTVDKTTGQMRNKDAMARWSSVIDTDGLWVGSFSYETTDKAVLAGQARAELQRRSAPAVNYEADFTTLPEDAQIGDRVNIIDDDGELYLEARLLKIETCEADGTKTATIGEYLLKSSGITEQVLALAEQVKQQAESDAQTKEQIQILTESVDSMLALEVSSQIIQGQAHLKAKLLNGNKDVTEEHSPALYKWILRIESGERLLGRGYTLNVDLATIGYAGTILCRFIRPELYDLTDHNLTVITDQDGNAIQVSYAGLYSQPVVQRMRSLKALNKASNTRAVQTEETGYATLSREVNLYEKDAYKMPTGGLGGFVYMKPNADGKPEEILIMDTPDIETAQNVWRWGKDGLMHSSNGYEGEYTDVAITADGKINADTIRVGTLSADRVRGGTLIAGGYNDRAGALEILDADGNKTGEITSNGLRVRGLNTAGNSVGVDLSNGWVQFFFEEGSASDLWSIPRVGYMNGGDLGVIISGGPPTSSGLLFLKKESTLYASLTIMNDLIVLGTKSRKAKTDNYNERLLYAYEMAEPIFGDIGEGVLDQDGLCYVDLDDIFRETIADNANYQVFLQKEGYGDCWVAEKTPCYFVVQGTPDLKISWEIKAKQKGYENTRLDEDYYYEEGDNGNS